MISLEFIRLCEKFDVDPTIYALYCERFDRDPRGSIQSFKEEYIGLFDSEMAFTKAYYSGPNTVPDHAINWRSLEARLFADDYFVIQRPGGVAVFRMEPAHRAYIRALRDSTLSNKVKLS